ncbi:MAG: hypothetical protein A7315_07670 [Candidatus Altiarchaeales archaeon WOR_SM1_79]|nr:MAG: hypothetical protein A7315_07670 [Candidatus Altiarchaeales archaeon WOR_SM1_79]
MKKMKMDKNKILVIAGCGILVIVLLWWVLVYNPPTPCNAPSTDHIDGFGALIPVGAVLLQNGTFISTIVNGEGLPITIMDISVIHEGKYYNERGGGSTCYVDRLPENGYVSRGSAFMITATCPQVNIKDKTAYLHLTMEHSVMYDDRVEEHVSVSDWGICLPYDIKEREYSIH